VKAWVIITLSQPRKTDLPPAPRRALKWRAGGARSQSQNQGVHATEPKGAPPAQPLLQTLPVRDLEFNKEYFQVLRDKELQMGQAVGGKDAITYPQTSSYAANLFRSYFFSPDSVKMTVGKYWQLFLGR